MQTTTNYGFSIAEGSDSVNLLTQLYPNFTSLDGILLPIQNNGTTPATHTKAGTVHQLVRTTTGCSVLRFVATGNYNSGDTFTVDGASVTATSCNGQSLPTGAFVINQSVMAILNGAVLTVLAGGSSISDASDVNYDNTSSGLSATNVQTAIDEVYGDIPTGFPSTAITYNNAISGLSATDVQGAIDELASSTPGPSGDEHGLIELWYNPTYGASYSGETVTITVDDTSKYDSLVFAIDFSNSEANALSWCEIPLDFPSIVDTSLCAMGQESGTVSSSRRKVTITKTSTVFTVVFGQGYSGGGTASNNYAIPHRIMGLIHNS